MNTAHRSPGVLICRGSYRAGIQDHDIGVLNVGRALQPSILKLAFDRGTIRLGGPAAKILYVKTIHSLIVPSDLGGCGAPSTPGRVLRSMFASARSTPIRLSFACHHVCCWLTTIRQCCSR